MTQVGCIGNFQENGRGSGLDYKEIQKHTPSYIT